MTRTDISNSQDVIDSRDVIARIEELESELQDMRDSEQTEETGAVSFEEWLETVDDDGDHAQQEEAHELIVLRALAEEASGSPDWKYGESLIRDSYFTRYAEQLADDIGAIDRNAHWPLDHIDWEQAAEALKQDYMSVDYDGVEYWIRA